jgi:hypothetical protein
MKNILELVDEVGYPCQPKKGAEGYGQGRSTEHLCQEQVFLKEGKDKLTESHYQIFSLQ